MRQRDLTSLISLAIILGFTLTASITRTSYAAGHVEHIASKPPTDFQGDFLLFPELTDIARFDQTPRHLLTDNDFIPGINAFYTADYQRLRFLGEWLVNSKTHNLERIQLGLHLGESSLWLGRFHNPIGYWNMQYHHAAFLQSTISRPGIMAFETAGGVIPNHLTGFLWEGIHDFGESGIYYTLGAGAGPQISKGLSALNLIEPGGSHRPAVSFRLGYQPISYGINEIGVSGAYTEIPAQNLPISDVKQFVGSIYANWQYQSLHFVSEMLYTHNQLNSLQLNRTNSEFVNVYGQLEWEFKQDWTVTGRVEGTFARNNDPYLAYFPKYVQDRFLGGLRYKVNQNMALKVEISQDHLRDDRFGQVMMQWSAVFP